MPKPGSPAERSAPAKGLADRAPAASLEINPARSSTCGPDLIRKHCCCGQRADASGQEAARVLPRGAHCPAGPTRMLAHQPEDRLLAGVWCLDHLQLLPQLPQLQAAQQGLQAAQVG